MKVLFTSAFSTASLQNAFTSNSSHTFMSSSRASEGNKKSERRKKKWVWLTLADEISRLTELCQIDARSMRLNLDLRAHLPEQREDKCDDAKEAQDDDPKNLQDVGDDHEDGAWNSSADSWSPGSIHFVPRCACRKAPNEQNHEAEGSHWSCDCHEDHLNSFDPQKLEMKDVVEHDDSERRAAIHCATEHSHTNQQHHRCHQGGERYSGDAWFAAVT